MTDTPTALPPEPDDRTADSERDTWTKLRELHEIQGRHGNWNYSPYMLGLFNGLELALATLAGRDPTFREKPERWLADIPEAGILPVAADTATEAAPVTPEDPR